MAKENSTEQLKLFLKEMFQFNTNDLDFGIYRIYNLKRKEIVHFIDGKDEQCLETIIDKTLSLVSNIEKAVELTCLTAYLKQFNQESLEIEYSNRKYILVEMGTYFNSVTKKRIQRVIYSQNWEAGKSLDNDGSKKHIFKYIVLEQYEDVLDAIEQFEGETPKNLPLKYLYKPELNKINSTLDLSKPFSNKIKYGQPTREGFIDLADTYNYLQGYEVKSIKTYTISEKYYKVVETADTLVIWRDIKTGEDDSKTIIEIIEKYPEVVQIEVNYDFNILATQKGKQLEAGKRVLGVTIIHAEIFNV